MGEFDGAERETLDWARYGTAIRELAQQVAEDGYVADLILAGLGTPADAADGARPVRLSNLARVKDIVRQRMDNPELTLADIAEAAGFSLSYLHNLFRDQGQTLYAYLKSARLQRARGLLQMAASRGMSVTDVCLSCGFSDTAYFSRSFRQAFGISPRDALRRC